MQPLIITAAIVGAETMREHNPNVPYTPEEIAAEAQRCAQAGAHIIHVHGRHDDGTPTQDKVTFGRILEGIRGRTDAIVQFSTGGAVGMDVETRIEGLVHRPQMATLTTGTVNFGEDVFVNDLPTIRTIAARLKELDITPEIEIFDTGMIDTALRLVKEELLTLPLHFDFVMGVPGGMGAHRPLLLLMVDMLPDGCTWSVAGIGRHQLPMAKIAIEMGGHVRVGLEDNIYIDRGVLAQGSWELVEAVVAFAEEKGRPIATMEQARQILGLA